MCKQIQIETQPKDIMQRQKKELENAHDIQNVANNHRKLWYITYWPPDSHNITKIKSSPANS